MSVNPRLFSSLAVVGAAAALVACAQPAPLGSTYPAGSYPTTSYPAGQQYAQFGRVSNVEYVRGGQSAGIAGAVVGGAVGGLAGNQVGGGSGRTAATVAGVVGGALIGRALEQNMNRNNVDHYRVTVQFDNGSVRQFDYAQPPNVQIGDRVRADGDQLYR
ncbi:glycine zipper 2TM domain-containing protein [Ottowia sp.]|uniref:glycine zipper 2TM domain-containing protein n=1 Tax=Ottowia sp. TaxID=1898956 RepID=UPI002C1783EE|nr:glycine zipper 2TM domain-containing protein [Ottowia sp.]HOB66548.1 glycine zipper 2TM domain-containing protein [Ottowia sp.]HPZ58071.1 glycine zipper 2TM domain-containing protein [Ottowia sp.]HQD49087.1 glycine zipper 2TM domain-containing protein [Ottowia sp.]